MPGLTMNCDSACIPIEKPLRKRLLNRVRLESSVVPPMPAPYLYMPMEIASRELDSRLLIALFAVQAGLEVVIGQKWLLQKNARAMPKGYWIFKTLTPGDAKQMQRIQKLGHAIAAIDEEMPGLGDGSQRLRWVDPRSVNATEAIFCLGRQHVAAMERSYPDHAHKLITTGNPRWDFLRPELRGIYAADAAAITRDYGRFLLVNTNIGLVNSAKNSPEGLIRALTGDGRINLDLPEDRAFVTDLQAFERANFAAAAPLVRRLSEAFPDRQIVLRPHPTEKLEPYQTALAGVPRAHIVREGPAAAWLSAADLLIHTSCTTATEAFALGKPAICYQTIPSPLHSYFLSSALSAIARSEDEVIAETQRILAAGSDDPRRRRRTSGPLRGLLCGPERTLRGRIDRALRGGRDRRRRSAAAQIDLEARPAVPQEMAPDGLSTEHLPRLLGGRYRAQAWRARSSNWRLGAIACPTLRRRAISYINLNSYVKPFFF